MSGNRRTARKKGVKWTWGASQKENGLPTPSNRRLSLEGWYPSISSPQNGCSIPAFSHMGFSSLQLPQKQKQRQRTSPLFGLAHCLVLTSRNTIDFHWGIGVCVCVCFRVSFAGWCNSTPHGKPPFWVSPDCCRHTSGPG